jgi:hypothetical protein
MTTLRVVPVARTPALATLAHQPVVSISFATDATYGTFISHLRAGAIDWTFAAEHLLVCGVWKESTDTASEIDSDNFTITTDTDADGIVTIIATATGLYAGIVCTFVGTPTYDGFSWVISWRNSNATYGLEWIEFPRLYCKPSTEAGNMRIAHGLSGGFVVQEPHDFDASGLLNSPEAPGSMQFWDYYDVTTKAHLYVQTDDDGGYKKTWRVTGDGSANVLQRWRHHTENPRIAENDGLYTEDTADYTYSYTVRTAAFRGRVADGRCGHYDSAIRYREWVLATNPAWLSRGAWKTASSIPSRLRSSLFYYVLSPGEGVTAPALFWTTFVTDITRVKDYIGATHCLSLWYGWGTGMATLAGTNFKPPSLLPLIQSADQNTALGTANTQNIHVTPYTFLTGWDSDIASGDFSYSGFIGTSDYAAISAFCVRDVDDDAQLDSDNIAYFDCANNHATIKAIVTDILNYNAAGSSPSAFGYYRQTVNKPHGYYWDFWGGGGNLLTYSPSVSPNGNTGDWESGKKTISDYVRAAMVAIDANFFQTTEGCEEHLIPSFDAMHVTGDIGFGRRAELFSIVYSRYQPIFELDVSLSASAVTDIPNSNYLYYTGTIAWIFHQTGHLCLKNETGLKIVPTNPPNLSNCAFFYSLEFMRLLIANVGTTTAILTYMHEGYRLRPLEDAIEGDLIDDEDWQTNLFGTAAPLISSVWRNATTGDTGIVVTNHHTATQTLRIRMEATAYELDPGAVHILYRNVGGVRSELTRFTDSLDYSLTTSYYLAGTVCELFEVVIA